MDVINVVETDGTETHVYRIENSPCSVIEFLDTIHRHVTDGIISVPVAGRIIHLFREAFDRLN